MKAKFLLIIFVVSLLMGILPSVSARDSDRYVVVLKEEYASDSVVLEYLEPLWEDARIYILKDNSKLEFVSSYAESIEKDEPLEVVFEEPDPILMTEPTDQYFSRQWDHAMINVKASRDIENYGQGVKVGVIDSGCYAHPDFENRLLTGKNYFSGTTDVTDNVGHGTHVCGIIAAGMNDIGVCGVAPKAYIVPLKAFDTNKSTYSTTLATAIRDAVDVFDCDIINMSFGMNTNPSTLRSAINYAAEKGVILVASAGNDETLQSPNQISYPAYYDVVISVASVTSTGNRAQYSFCNSGVTVAAPGSSIYSTSRTGSYQSMTGTSQAAPHVAGIASLALSINPNLTREKFVEILTSTCTDKGDPGRDDLYGHGLVNIEAMIEKIMEDVPLYVSPVHQSGNTCSFHIRNNTDTPYEAAYIYTSYDNSAMTNVDATYVNLNKGMGKTVSYDAGYAKHFVWESFESLKPLKKPEYAK